MSQHAPAPWTAEDIPGKPRHLFRIADSENVYICESDSTRPDGWANARLIAKAPEMFSDLPYYLEWMELSHGKCNLNSNDCYAEQYGDGSPEQHKRILHTRALLNEIEGEK